MGERERPPFADVASTDHEWHCGPCGYRWGYDAAGDDRRNCRSGIDRGAVVPVGTTRHAGDSHRRIPRHDAGLAARRDGTGKGPMDGQRRRKSGSHTRWSRIRGTPRVSCRWDAAVVGAGPAGSATALLLARAGARVLLLDRAQFPREKPCSEYLSPESTRVLARLGA